MFPPSSGRSIGLRLAACLILLALATLVPAGPAHAQTNLNVKSNSTPPALTVTWTPPSRPGDGSGWPEGPSGPRYRVQWKTGQQSYSTAERIASTRRSRYVISGLSGSTTYMVRVCRIGSNDPCLNGSGTTPAAVSLTASAVTHNGATLTIGNYEGPWRHKKFSPATPAGTCAQGKNTLLTSPQRYMSRLTGLAPSTTYIWKAYLDNSCTIELASVRFTTAPSLTASAVTHNSATLTLENYPDSVWHYRRISPTREQCAVISGSTTVSVGGLAPDTTYIYAAYHRDNVFFCLPQNRISSTAEFTTLAAPGTPGITVTPSTLQVAEDGGTATFNVKLNTQPSNDVTVRLSVFKPSSSDDQTIVTINDPDPITTTPKDLTFTSSNWNQQQTVTVTGVNDDDDNPGDQRVTTIQMVVNSNDNNYFMNTGQDVVTVTVTDDDDATVQGPGPGPGPESPDPGPESPDPGPESPEPGPESPEPGPESPEPGPESPEPGPESPEPGPESPEPGPESPDNKVMITPRSDGGFALTLRSQHEEGGVNYEQETLELEAERGEEPDSGYPNPTVILSPEVLRALSERNSRISFEVPASDSPDAPSGFRLLGHVVDISVSPELEEGESVTVCLPVWGGTSGDETLSLRRYDGESMQWEELEGQETIEDLNGSLHVCGDTDELSPFGLFAQEGSPVDGGDPGQGGGGGCAVGASSGGGASLLFLVAFALLVSVSLGKARR